MSKFSRWEVALALVATLVVGWVWGIMSASADAGRSVYSKVDGSGPARIVVRCDWQEDAAAHLQLVSYTPERIVYRCERGGY